MIVQKVVTLRNERELFYRSSDYTVSICREFVLDVLKRKGERLTFEVTGIDPKDKAWKEVGLYSSYSVVTINGEKTGHTMHNRLYCFLTSNKINPKKFWFRLV